MVSAMMMPLVLGMGCWRFRERGVHEVGTVSSTVIAQVGVVIGGIGDSFAATSLSLLRVR
jgi:hypothetical protein